MLQSQDPYERQQGITLLNSHEAFHGRSMAYAPALQLYPQEIDPEVKRGLLGIISDFSGGKDPRALDILIAAMDDPDFGTITTAVFGLARFGDKAAPAVPKIRDLYQDPTLPSSGKRALMRLISEIGPPAETVFDIVTGELTSTSWLMRRASLGSVKRLKKKNVNVVGFLVHQLESGDADQKVAACADIGALAGEAKGSATALANALADPVPDVRAKTAWALLQMGKNAAPAESALQQALKDDSPVVAKFSLKSIAKFKKLSNEQKDEIKEMDATEKEMKSYRGYAAFPLITFSTRTHMDHA